MMSNEPLTEGGFNVILETLDVIMDIGLGFPVNQYYPY